MAPKPKEDDVLEVVRASLKQCKSKWTLLSKQTSRKLSYRWIVGFANGEIKDPSFSKVLLLACYLGMKISLVPGPHFLKFEVK